MTYGLGIDVGTTFTAAAVYRDGQVRTVTLGQNGDAMPTTVYLTEAGEFVVGDVARRRLAENPAGGAREFKRRLGDSTPLVLNGSPYSSDRLMGAVFRHVIRVVSETEGEPPAHIVVTHPSNWQAFKIDLVRQAAVAAAGSASVSLIEEPIAAAIYYAHAGRIEVGELVGVYDLGGGTFDAAVLQRTQTGFRRLGEPAGIERLGGIDFDAALMAHVQQTLGERFTALDTKDPAVRIGLEDLRVECIEAKQALSADTTATIHVGVPGLHDSVRITRAEFEQLVRPVLRETIDSLRTAIHQAGTTADQLATVLLIGGSSRIPLVSDIVSAEIGRPVAVDTHPKFAVAMGAAVASQADVDSAPAAVPLPVEGDANGDDEDSVHEATDALTPTGWHGMNPKLVNQAGIVAAGVLALAAGGVTAALLTGGKDTPKPDSVVIEQPFVEIDSVTLDDGRYRVEYQVTGFRPGSGTGSGSRHIHFFLDTTEPENAGSDGKPPGEWGTSYSSSTFLTKFTPGNRNGAERICAIVANGRHEVVDPASGNCSALPDDQPSQPTVVPRQRPRESTPTPTHSPTPTDSSTPTPTPTPTDSASAAGTAP